MHLTKLDVFYAISFLVWRQENVTVLHDTHIMIHTVSISMMKQQQICYQRGHLKK